MATPKQLVLELAESMGLDGLVVAENGVTGIQFDDLALNIHADSENGELTLFLRLGDVPADPSERLLQYAYLLKENNFSRNTGGAVLGIDDAESAVYLSHRFATDLLDAPHLERIVEGFLNLADSFIAGLREAGQSASCKGGIPGGGMQV